MSASSTLISSSESTRPEIYPKLFANSSWTATIYPFLLSRKPSPSLGEIWNGLVTDYRSRSYQPLVIIAPWNEKYADSIRKISEKRGRSRCENYFLLPELERVQRKLAAKREAAIRFGASKPGHGYHGERGDFCLVGGAIKGRDLTLFYRSLELIGGLAYDLVLVQELGKQLNINWRTLSIHAAKANVFALKGNSNEKLYPRLQRIFAD